jgi:YesN/AraC family two-component response regulator
MGKAKILIVDDEKIVLKAFSRELEHEGYTVFRAITGSEALKIAEREKPEIVFTDLVMPEMNGLEICKAIKQMLPGTEVVLISGFPEEVLKYGLDFVKAGGREEWLRKPLAADELPKAAKKLLFEKTGKKK